MVQDITGWNGGRIKAWTDGVEFEFEAQKQVHNIAGLPFVHDHVAIMPDCHAGIGATVGSVIPTHGAIIPAAVGVDIGCGMMAIRTSLTANDLPDSLSELRSAIERSVPVGNGPGGGWATRSGTPSSIMTRWRNLEKGFDNIVAKYPDVRNANPLHQLGTLGGGNHFIEVCLDTTHIVWVMLHSGSRNVGNRIGKTFIERAREKLISRGIHVPDKDLAWLAEGEQEFNDYIEGMLWAQDYAMENRKSMMERVLGAMRDTLPTFTTDKLAVNCHHNFAAKENHFGADVWVTRKGAVRAQEGELGIIPGSMGAKSYIVRGKGNPDSFCSCSHGAGRRMSRSKAKASFTEQDLIAQTMGVECRKDTAVIDEIPAAYKDIDAVMAAQTDLVEVVAQLKQVLCVKG